MKKFYKIGIFLLVGLFVFTLNVSNAASRFWQNDRVRRTSKTVDDPVIDTEVVSGIPEGTKYETNKLKGILNFEKREEYSTGLGYALSLIQISINWILGLLALVALIYMLYCGFLVFSSGSEDKNAQKGKKGLSTAAIALAGIGLSWMIVSIMIRLITTFADV